MPLRGSRGLKQNNPKHNVPPDKGMEKKTKEDEYSDAEDREKDLDPQEYTVDCYCDGCPEQMDQLI